MKADRWLALTAIALATAAVAGCGAKRTAAAARPADSRCADREHEKPNLPGTGRGDG